MIWEMYEPALDAGIGINTFWNSSLAEVEDLIASNRRMRERDFKEKVLHDFIMAEVAFRYQSNFFRQTGEEMELPKVWNYYPSLFDDVEKEYKEAQDEINVEQQVIERKRYVKAFNERFNRD